MNRRDFFKSTASAGAMMAIGGLAATLPLEGCSVNVKALLNVVLDSAEAIIKVAEPGASWLTPLENAIAALQQAETAWEGGSPVAIVESALNTLEAVLAVIPATMIYAPLIAVLVAGIEAVLNALFPTPSATAAIARSKNPYVGRVVLHKTSLRHLTVQGAYRAQWNEVADGINLPAAKI